VGARPDLQVLFLCAEEDQRALSGLVRLARARGISPSLLVDRGDLPATLPKSLAAHPSAVLAPCRTPAPTSARMRLIRKLFVKHGGREDRLVAVPLRPGGDAEAIAIVLGRILRLLRHRP
jgi:hypothetical protein